MWTLSEQYAVVTDVTHFIFLRKKKKRNEKNKLTNAMELEINKGSYVLCFPTSGYSNGL